MLLSMRILQSLWFPLHEYTTISMVSYAVNMTERLYKPPSSFRLLQQGIFYLSNPGHFLPHL